MKKILNYIKSLGITTLSILFLTIISTLFQYFNIFSSNIFKILFLIISVLLGSYYLGKNSLKKGYLEGTKYGIILTILLIIITLIFFKSNFQIKNILYYIIIIISSIVGSMIGIQKKKDN